MRTLKELLIIVRDELEKQGRIDRGLCHFTTILDINRIINEEEGKVLTSFFIDNSPRKIYDATLFSDYEFHLNWLNHRIELMQCLNMERIVEFLLQNRYKEDSDKKSEYRTFNKHGVSSIDVNSTEIVFIGEEGDWLHIPVNIYALIGVLLHYKQIAVDYNF